MSKYKVVRNTQFPYGALLYSDTNELVRNVASVRVELHYGRNPIVYVEMVDVDVEIEDVDIEVKE